MFAQHCFVLRLVFGEKKNKKSTPYLCIAVGFKDGGEEEKRKGRQRRQQGAREINLWATQIQVIQKKRQRM